MASLIVTALCGLKDAFNPCMFTTIFFLLFLAGELRRRGFDVRWYAALFISVSFVSFLFFSFGLLMPILFSDQFYFVAGRFYLTAGILLCVLGALYLRAWWLIRQKREPVITSLVDIDSQGKRNVIVLLGVFAAAVVLSAFNTIWPMDHFVMFYSNFLMVPGKSLETYITLFVYHLALIVFLTGSFVLVSSDYFGRVVKRIPSMIKIVQSAFSFSIGVGLIYIFY